MQQRTEDHLHIGARAHRNAIHDQAHIVDTDLEHIGELLAGQFAFAGATIALGQLHADAVMDFE